MMTYGMKDRRGNMKRERERRYGAERQKSERFKETEHLPISAVH